MKKIKHLFELSNIPQRNFVNDTKSKYKFRFLVEIISQDNTCVKMIYKNVLQLSVADSKFSGKHLSESSSSDLQQADHLLHSGGLFRPWMDQSMKNSSKSLPPPLSLSSYSNFGISFLLKSCLF